MQYSRGSLRPSRSLRLPFVLTFLAGAIFASARPAGAATGKEVQEAIDRAKAFLYKEQKGDNWEEVPAPDPNEGARSVRGQQWGGLTSMAVYALLAAGEKPTAPKLAPAIEWLKKAKIHGEYAVGMRSQVWTFLADREGKLASKNDFDTLMKAVHPDGPGKGFYPYYITDDGKRGPEADYFDMSVSQYGVLGMWACEQAGQEVPDAYWAMVDAAWKSVQESDGGWPYKTEGKRAGAGSKTTMAAAGIATLFITQDHMLNGRHWDPCVGGQRNENIEKGLAYMDKHVDELLDGNYYGMYGVERIGVASGHKYFGTIDWYATGSNFLVRRQEPNGSWGGSGGGMRAGLGAGMGGGRYGAIPDTVFATIFLVRGRAPVMMNKLQWTATGKQPDPWDERPCDVANCAHWAGGQIERYLNWQVVNLKVSADALHDAPILYIAGSEAMTFDPADTDKLRDFVHGGGMILGNADCGSRLFTKSFTDLAAKLFPKYEFRDLPPTHPIYTNEQFRSSKWSTHSRVLGLSNGVRELMILIPDADLSRVWQVRAEKTRQDTYQLGQDIFLYSIDKENLLDRGETYVVKARESVKTTHEVKVARLIAGDNPDPEPGGWKRLANLMHNEDAVALDVQDVKLGDGKLTGYKLAHLTGTTKFNLRDEQRKELKDFVDHGGTLVVDAAGGAGDFANSAERELPAIFGAGTIDSMGSILPPDSPVYTIEGSKIESFRYRPFMRGKLTGKLNAPEVRGIEQGKDRRIAVFYSPLDLTAGLVGQPVDGIFGYEAETATNIMRNIVLYSAGIKSVRAHSEPKSAPPAETPNQYPHHHPHTRPVNG
jgi:hypothetical protein